MPLIEAGPRTEGNRMTAAHVPISHFRKPAALLMAGALLIGLTSAVSASAPPATTIKACVNKVTKVTRVTIYASPTFCKPTESYKQWNVTGPMGPQGATGATGATGAMARLAPPVRLARLGRRAPRAQRVLIGPTGASGADGATGSTGADGGTGRVRWSHRCIWR